MGGTERTNPAVKYTAEKSDILVHPGWNRKTGANDIALIKIKKVTLTDRIQVVALPKMSSSYSNYAGDWAIASGWGRISDSSSSSATQLQFGRMQVITNTACTVTYGSTITSNMICTATAGNISTCNGDSGGPLVQASTRAQIGLVSFGSNGGCAKGNPVAFTRVTSYLNWIQENTNIKLN